MSFYCLDCKEYFDEPVCETLRYRSNYIGYGGDFEETQCKCPNCGSEDFEEAKDECDACHTFVYETHDVNGVYLCDECYDKLKNILSDTVDKIVGELDIDSLQAQVLVSSFYDE